MEVVSAFVGVSGLQGWLFGAYCTRTTMRRKTADNRG